jgi:DNA-binding NtrC family response regulator
LRRTTYEKVEREYLIALLTGNRGKINETARIAGVTPRQINKLLTKYSIRKEEYKSN